MTAWSFFLILCIEMCPWSSLHSQHLVGLVKVGYWSYIILSLFRRFRPKNISLHKNKINLKNYRLMKLYTHLEYQFGMHCHSPSWQLGMGHLFLVPNWISSSANISNLKCIPSHLVHRWSLFSSGWRRIW